MSVDQAGKDSSALVRRDLTRVTQRVESGRFRHLDSKVKAGTALPYQIREWYVSLDPLGERESLSVLSNASTGGNLAELTNATIRESYLFESAAASVLRHVGAFSIGPLLTDEAASEIQRRIEGGSLTVDDMQNLLLAVDLLKDAGFGLTSTRKFSRRIGLDQLHSDEPAFQNLDQRSEDLPVLSLGILLFLRNRFKNNKDIEDPEVRMLGAEAIFREATSLGVLISENGLEASRDFRRDQLRDMIDAVEGLFLGEKGLLMGSNPIPRSTIKGKFFELDWVMDAFMFNFLKDDYDTQVIMSSIRGDRPMVGRPKLNRGSDITIRNFRNWTEYFVQLKSSEQQKGKQYHPLIEVAYEQNFQDMNPGRLANKIRAYRAFIDSGFDPALGESARKFILPTVVGILEKERTPSDSYDRLADLHGIAPIRKRQGSRPDLVTLNIPPRKSS